MKELKIVTRERISMTDITADVRKLASQYGDKTGALLLFCPHTTCGLTINEGADPAVAKDLTRFFTEKIPYKNAWLHAEGNSDAHVKSTLFGSSLMLPLEKGIVRLGTWQSIYLMDGDGPRTRSVWMSLLPEIAE